VRVSTVAGTEERDGEDGEPERRGEECFSTQTTNERANERECQSNFPFPQFLLLSGKPVLANVIERHA